MHSVKHDCNTVVAHIHCRKTHMVKKHQVFVHTYQECASSHDETMATSGKIAAICQPLFY